MSEDGEILRGEEHQATEIFLQGISNDLDDLGGVLRCEACKTTMPLGNVADKIANGWPTCCGVTLRWWTQKQVDAREL